MNTNGEMIDYRILYKDEKVLGLLGQDKEGSIETNTKDELSDKILKSLIKPLKINETDVIGDFIITKSRIVLTSEIDWLVHIEYDLPFNFYATPIQQTSKKTFIAFDLKNIKRES